jgi:hypothetical protein
MYGLGLTARRPRYTENASTGTGADQRCEGTTWKASPAWMYSTMRATVASNSARDRFGEKRGMFRAITGWAGRGTGPANRSRTRAIASHAAAYERSTSSSA